MAESTKDVGLHNTEEEKKMQKKESMYQCVYLRTRKIEKYFVRKSSIQAQERLISLDDS